MATNALDSSNSPLTADQAARVRHLVETLDADRLGWVSGYLAGLRDAAAKEPAAASVAEPAGGRLTILYGSETGNAERLAQQAAEAAGERGIPARVLDMADYKPRELRDERLLLIVTATHGEGDPPDPAADFYEFLHGRKAPKLAGAKFAVLALGDSSYEHFCRTGRDFDARLEALGAERLTERLECDVDFEDAAAEWIASVLDVYARHVETPPAEPASSKVVAFTGGGRAAPEPAYDRNNPFAAEVLENLVLNGRGSERETRHIELSLEGSGLEYAPGDVLGVVAPNPDKTVSELVEALALDPEQPVAARGGERSLSDALRRDYEITTLTPGFVRAWAGHVGDDSLRALTAEGSRSELVQFMAGRDAVDLVTEYPASTVDAAAFLGMLRKLQPREYSIASSLAANPDEVHLTVAAVRYESRGRRRFGVASTHLADRAEPGRRVEVFVRRNKNFRLPADAGAPVIMVGPGTGVAPFRAFLQEREINGTEGASWLFFGSPRMRTDFLYQTEWQRWLTDGVLERLDVAFSRDQAHKVYVQDRMRESGAELYRWLEHGAYLYVCGDAERMAPDVHAALVEIVELHGGHSKEAAAEYVRQLQREKRYQRDVY